MIKPLTARNSKVMLLLILLLPLTLAARPLIMAVGLAKPPYIEGDGHSGLEVAISLAALQAAGLTAFIEQMPQARALQSLKQGSVDIMLGTTPGLLAERCYSMPLLFYRNRAISLSERKLNIRQIADLAPLRIAAFQNASKLLGDEFARVSRLSPNYSEHADQDTLNKLLLNDRVDVIISDELIFFANPTQADRFGHTHATSRSALFGDSPRHAAFLDPLACKQFSLGLSYLHQSGEYRRIVQEYRARYQLPDF